MTIINDPLIAPYYIGKDAHCYTAYEVITPDPKYTNNGNIPESSLNNEVSMFELSIGYRKTLNYTIPWFDSY